MRTLFAKRKPALPQGVITLLPRPGVLAVLEAEQQQRLDENLPWMSVEDVAELWLTEAAMVRHYNKKGQANA